MTEPDATGIGGPAATAGAALPLTGETVVVTGLITGSLAALSRNEMNELIERAGGRAPRARDEPAGSSAHRR